MAAPRTRHAMKLALAILTAFASCTMFFAFLASLIWFFFRLGLPPCAEESTAYLLSQLLVPVTCLISTVWLGVLVRWPNGWHMLIAPTLPAAALLIVWGLSVLDARTQRRCEAQTLTQAKASCRINPAVYRDGRDHYGNATLTLTAPGTTDLAHYCLERWAMHNGAVSLIIDESVYQQARATPANVTSPRPPR